MDMIARYKSIKINRYFEKLFASEEYLELDEIYHQVLSQVVSFFFDEMHIFQPIQVGIAYNILLELGYLSFDHCFKYEDPDLLFISNEGPMILTGVGVCRNITCFLHDLFSEMNIDSSVAFIRKRCFDNFSIPENKASFFDMDVYDHCMNFIHNDGKPYFFDATKQIILEYVSDNVIRSVIGWDQASNEEIQYKFSFINLFLLPNQDLQRPILCPISDEFLSDIKQQIETTVDLLNVSSLNDFYQGNQKYYERATYLADHIKCKQKKLGVSI